ncbi:glycosyltransferase [Nonomuraea purpurea]|uniref:Glycosyltransferase n=1 Tax=Nonomuraea purpurea TaxID=1849276 RepID=A0ABV8GRF3_9ACTN
MRFLFTCISGYSHFYNVVPLAFAARERGHEVAFSSAPEIAPGVEAAGFRLLPSGPGRLRMRKEILRSHSAEISEDIRDWRVGARMFGDVALRLRWKELHTVVNDFRPDAIISESLELAGPLVARLRGLPHFFLSIGPYYADSITQVWQRAAPLFREHAGPGITLSDIVEPYIEVCPPALQTPEGKAITTTLPAGIRAYHGEGGSQPPDGGRDAHPQVLITFGTVSNGAISLLHESAARLGRMGMRVVMTLGPQGWFDWSSPSGGTAATSMGDNVRVVRYVPLNAELPATSVLIHHGGSNTMRAAIEHSVPTLVIPQGAEQYRNAELIEECGLGRMLLPSEVTPESVAEHVSALLDDADTAERLAKVRRSWLAMPPSTDTIDDIERRCAQTTPRKGWTT